MLEVDGNGASRRDRLIRVLGQSDGELQEPAGPDEVVGKMRTEGIASPGRTADLSAPLATQGVIHQRDHGGRIGQTGKDLVLHRGPELAGIDTLLFK